MSIKLFKEFQSTKTVKADGLAPITGYEPWALRTRESIKQSLSDDIPVLIRVHPAADYPCKDAEQGYKLDMESHAIMIIGYDDETQMFDVVDPWNQEWGGQFGGLGKIPYDIIPITCVNSSYGIIQSYALPHKEVIAKVDSNNNASIHLLVGYYVPRGYIVDEKFNAITKLDLEVSYETNGEIRTYKQEIDGRWHVGQNIETDIPLGKEIEGEIEVNFDLHITLEGKRPYAYQDTIQFYFEESLRFANNNSRTLKENDKNKSAITVM